MVKNFIEVKGAIISNDEQWIYDWFDMDSTSPRKVTDQLYKYRGQDVEIVINSGGGDVYAGSEIYTALKEHDGNVTTKIVGIAASAASIIAMGGRVLISPTAQMMIHNVSSIVRGDHRAIQHEAEVLKEYNRTISSAYRLKSGLEEDILLEMMNKETWLSAKQALELNLVDEILFENQQPKLVASNGLSAMIPESVVEKIRNMKHLIDPSQSPSNEVVNDLDFLMQKKLSAQLNLLKLGGIRYE